jgi:hypothetical protein
MSDTSTTFTVYLPVRAVSGLYSTNLTAANQKKHKKPSSLEPMGYVNGDKDKPVLISPSWSRYLGLEIGGRKLGGSSFPTVPEVASFVTQQQVDAQLSAAQDQWAAANAQALQTLIAVVQAAGLTGSDAIPPAVLARQETNPQPVSDFGYQLGGGGGGDGGGGGGGGD